MLGIVKMEYERRSVWPLCVSLCTHTLGPFTQDVFYCSEWSWDAFLSWTVFKGAWFLGQFKVQNPLCISMSLHAQLICLSVLSFRCEVQGHHSVQTGEIMSLSINCLKALSECRNTCDCIKHRLFSSHALILSQGKGQIARP